MTFVSDQSLIWSAALQPTYYSQRCHIFFIWSLHWKENPFSWKGGLLQGKERKAEKYRLVFADFFVPVPQNPKFWGKFSVERERSFCIWFLPSVSVQLRYLIPHSLYVPQPPQSQWEKALAWPSPQCWRRLLYLETGARPSAENCQTVQPTSLITKKPASRHF